MLARKPIPGLLAVVNKPPYLDIIGTQVSTEPFDVLTGMILGWAREHKSKFVCVANTHMLVEAYQKPSFSEVLKSADLVTPDGMPLVWMLKLMGIQTQHRVAGLDLMHALCQQATEENVSVFFLGSISSILQNMRGRMEKEFPDLLIAAMEPLPFRPLTPEEDQALIQRVNASGAGLVMIALGCPKQEYWMAEHRNQIEAVMIGLGGAFPVYAGLQRQAPGWIRKIGLEWLIRLIQEPRRLWKRYATTIPVFIYLASQQLWQYYARTRKTLLTFTVISSYSTRVNASERNSPFPNDPPQKYNDCKTMTTLKSYIADLFNRLGLAWWVEIKTSYPNCTYFFGPFHSRQEAAAAISGYVEDLEAEHAQGIVTTIQRVRPTTLTICSSGSFETIDRLQTLS